MAKSANDQCEMGRPSSAGLVVANTTTLCRSSGGKSPRSAAAREVGQAIQAFCGEAFSPLADRVGIATEFFGHHLVGRTVGLTAAQDDAAPKGLTLRRTVGMSNLFRTLF